MQSSTVNILTTLQCLMTASCARDTAPLVTALNLSTISLSHILGVDMQLEVASLDLVNVLVQDSDSGAASDQSPEGAQQQYRVTQPPHCMATSVKTAKLNGLHPPQRVRCTFCTL